MKVALQYVTHTLEQRELKSKKEAGKVFVRWQLSIGCLDPESRVQATFRLLSELKPVIPENLVMGQPVTLLLRPMRGQYEDSLGLAGVEFPPLAPKTK